MTLSAALNFFLSGTALLFIHSPRKILFRIAQTTGLLTGLISGIILVGYLYNIGQGFRIGPFSTMTLTSAALFFVLAVGIFGCYPDRGLFSVLYGGGNGTRIARFFLAVSVGGPGNRRVPGNSRRKCRIVHYSFRIGHRLDHRCNCSGYPDHPLGNVAQQVGTIGKRKPPCTVEKRGTLQGVV